MSSVQQKRHIAKAITWRVIASTTTVLLAWLFTGEITVGVGIGVSELVIKTLLYYFHERTWYRCKWGVRREYEVRPTNDNPNVGA